VTEILARDAAIAGVNGDFFDIDDTGAPWAWAGDRQRGSCTGAGSLQLGVLRRPAGDPRSARSPSRPASPPPGADRHQPELPVRGGPAGIGSTTPAGAGLPATASPTARSATCGWSRSATAGPGYCDEAPEGHRHPRHPAHRRGDGARALGRLRVGTRPGSCTRCPSPCRGDLRERPSWSATACSTSPTTARCTRVRRRSSTTTPARCCSSPSTGGSRSAAVTRWSMLSEPVWSEARCRTGPQTSTGVGPRTMVTKRPRGRIGVVNRPSDGFQRPVANAHRGHLHAADVRRRTGASAYCRLDRSGVSGPRPRAPVRAPTRRPPPAPPSSPRRDTPSAGS
jgi:hypothetical protein